MGNVLFIALTLALLAGFLFLTDYEERQGTRLFPRERGKLDAQVTRIGFVLAHVDLWQFLKDELARLAHRLGHDAARLSLEAVRMVERLLTRLVRRLRPHRPLPELTLPARPFVKTLSDFKERLKKAAEEGAENGSVDETLPKS